MNDIGCLPVQNYSKKFTFGEEIEAHQHLEEYLTGPGENEHWIIEHFSTKLTSHYIAEQNSEHQYCDMVVTNTTATYAQPQLVHCSTAQPNHVVVDSNCIIKSFNKIYYQDVDESTPAMDNAQDDEVRRQVTRLEVSKVVMVGKEKNITNPGVRDATTLTRTKEIKPKMSRIMSCFEKNKQGVEPPINVEEVQKSVVEMARIELKSKVDVRKVKLAGRKLNGKKQAGLNVSRIDDMLKSVANITTTVVNLSNKRKVFMDKQDETNINREAAAKRRKGE